MPHSEFASRVVWARTSDAEADDLSLLDAVERERRARYLREDDKRRFTLGVILTKRELSARTGRPPAEISLDRTCPGCGAQHGRPLFPGWHLSVSHSGGLVGLAVADVPVGLDVEERGRSLDEIADSVLAGEPPGDLHVYWTRKEALLKATGDGLRVPMTAVRVSAASAPAALLAWRGRADLPARTVLRDLDPAPGYAGALAFIRP
ncbi:4'-phosphopantetheinyl transferase superfamily protein [Actinocorallia sp. API 0066]|uniref:4'-phosphopantetheinyl transferase family protein n=1 Tax=Actinocorallia sp. API 0066 TaxID=2896846 RepID=UPI001E44B233|nr:4'-phosphopantetheinyl transferase superfamily protein [Actinocorallia sp. API 0066]MCD0451426.1 4'-phosphopantetheinyl transferase superfamily protein [Actinocorallia sp. API 0066]